MDPIMEELSIEGYHKVIKVTEPRSGLLAIIAIHDITLGPAVGGIRFRNYDSFEKGLEDVLRLSKGMTYKFALLPCSYGGGKSVVFADPAKPKNPELLRAFGRAIEHLEGLYYGAEDSGCSIEDLDIMREETSFLIGLGGATGAGNPAPYTAWGTFRGIEAALLHRFGSTKMEGKRIALQGFGQVGESLAEHLYWRGAEIIVADIYPERLNLAIKKFGIKVCSPDEILSIECDVLAPCAFGGIINKETIPHLKCQIIAGCANNQLQEDEDGVRLQERGILYAPDYVINAGGAMNCICEIEGYHPAKPRKVADRIFTQLQRVFDYAKTHGMTTSQAAHSLAEMRLAEHVLCSPSS